MVSSFGRLQHRERSSRRIEQGKKREAGEKGDIVCGEKIICTVNGRIIKLFTKKSILGLCKEWVGNGWRAKNEGWMKKQRVLQILPPTTFLRKANACGRLRVLALECT